MSISYDVEISGGNCRSEIFGALLESGVEFTVDKNIEKRGVVGFFLNLECVFFILIILWTAGAKAHPRIRL